MFSVMSLEELISKANNLLVEKGLDQPIDGRVSGVFSERTVRFLRQAGAISRPDGQGSAARWNETHLWQLVAVRALQAEGRSLLEARDRINGLDAEALQGLFSQSPSTTTSAEPSPPPCRAWQLGNGFFLLNSENQTLPASTIHQIRRLLAQPKQP